MITVSQPDIRLARRATGPLRVFNEAGVLGLADVHTAQRLAVLGREADESVQFAVALLVRALRLGSVCIDLTTIGRTVTAEGEEQIDISALPWPNVAEWSAACERSPLVAVGADAGNAKQTRTMIEHILDRIDR